MASLTLLLVSLLRTLCRFRTLFTLIVIGFEQVNLHWEEAYHTFHIAAIYKKHEMIVYAQSEIEFYREEKDRGEILQLDQFHTILV